MKNLLGLLSILLIVSCQFNGTNYNEESAKAEGQAVTDVLYDDIYKKDFTHAETLFSDQFLKITPKEELQKMFNTLSEKLGAYKSSRLVNWQTTNTVGTNASSTYVFDFEVDYDKYKANEKVTLTKENGVVKILGYHVNSEAFLN
ncbi:hypothetical protein FMM05_15380 [Flavobacterium zepuense]|uniref:DUF3887 domain-containing protein n=1 Tax=Flavobacterium zepuense TaxID=2593302 RepID=A0A552UXX5_9FLAO|nr:hypothetical protein [Flavobacterium zepuense]TRW23074.1 hypothetical protein FMM05_15380 [Flavobacterium zepuense]